MTGLDQTFLDVNSLYQFLGLILIIKISIMECHKDLYSGYCYFLCTGYP